MCHHNMYVDSKWEPTTRRIGGGYGDGERVYIKSVKMFTNPENTQIDMGFGIFIPTSALKELEMKEKHRSKALTFERCNHLGRLKVDEKQYMRLLVMHVGVGEPLDPGEEGASVATMQ